MAKIPVNQVGRVPVSYDAKRDRWRLSYFSEGRRVRKHYRTEKEAVVEWKNICDETAKHGKAGAAYSAHDRMEFFEAKRLCGNADLRDVAREWMAMRPGGGQSLSVFDALQQFTAQKEASNRSKRHLNTLKSHLDRFATSFGKNEIKSISGNAILSWLSQLGLSPRSVANYHTSLSNFFNWAARRGIVTKSPTEAIDQSDMPTVPKPPRGVLTVDQTSSMMAWLEDERPHFVACHALQCFAGIRAAEVERMQWDWIDIGKKTITLPGWVLDAETGEHTQGTKTQDDWVLHDLPDNIWTWLKKYKGKGKIRYPANKANGIMRQAFTTLPHPIPKWPHNAMRHTFCTMAISLHQSADRVALWSRHTNARQLYKSYVAKLVTKADAERYFAIVPN